MPTIRKQRYHEQIADVLRRQILADGRPGQRLPADTEQAARFHVSVPTIRQAYHLLCQEGLIERRHGSGTYVRREALVRRIAVVTSPSVIEQTASYFWLRVVQQVQQLLVKAGCDVSVDLGFGSDPPERPVAGVIALRPSPTDALRDNCLRANVPLVGNDSGLGCSVTTEPDRMIREAVRLLAKAGRRRLALLTLDKHHDRSPDDWLLESFRAALDEAGLPYHSHWACGTVDAARTGSAWNAFQSVWSAAPERPDGLIVADDTIFREAVMAILAEGIRVPDELLVVTHANRGSGCLYPFPTIRLEVDPDAYARALVDALLTGLDGQPLADRPIVVPFHCLGLDDAPNQTATTRSRP